MNISAVEARKRLGELLNRVMLTDEEIIIERAGKKVAKLTKANAADKKEKGLKQGKLDFKKAKGLGKEIWKGIDPDQYVRKERSQWE
jgi:prevent-host-death family protein